VRQHIKVAKAHPKPLGQVEAEGGGGAGKRGASFEGHRGVGALKTSNTASASPETALVCFFSFGFFNLKVSVSFFLSSLSHHSHSFSTIPEQYSGKITRQHHHVPAPPLHNL
jgi:hypothetical protein